MLALHNDSFGGKKLHVFSKNWYGLKEFSKKDFSALRILITYKLEINKLVIFSISLFCFIVKSQI